MNRTATFWICTMCLMLGVAFTTAGCGTPATQGQSVEQLIVNNEVTIRKAVEFGAGVILDSITDDAQAAKTANLVASIADIFTNATSQANVSLAAVEDAANTLIQSNQKIGDMPKVVAGQVVSLMVATMEGILDRQFANADAEGRTKATQVFLRAAAAGSAQAALNCLKKRSAANPTPAPGPGPAVAPGQ